MKPVIIAASLLFLMSSFLFSQDVIRIEMDAQKRYSPLPTSNGWQLLAKPRKDSIGFRQQNFLPVYPDLTSAPDTVFGAIYFDHQQDSIFPNSVFYLITDYQTDNAQFWIDHNLNHDFSDDGPSLSYNMEDSLLLVKVSNPSDSQTQKWLSMKPGLWNKNMRDNPGYSEFLENIFGNHPNFEGFEIIPVKLFQQDQQLWVKATDVIIKGDSFRVGIGDVDNDGRFNNEGTDKLLVGRYGEKKLSSDFFDGASVVSEGVMIKPGKQVYKIVEVGQYGEYIKLAPSTDDFPNLTNGSLIPDFSFETHEGDSTTLYRLLDNKPYTLIDVWGSWCAPCREEVPQLKELQSTWSSQLQILAVTKDSKESALAFIEEEGISWSGVWITDEFEGTATNKAYPFHILIGPDKRVIKFGVSIRSMAEYLDQ